jgi:MtN3 and saliva related transmembrane protein
MNYIDVIGLIAGAMGGLSLFPQVLKVIRTKTTKDISREMFLLLAGSIFLWLIYGFFLNNFPIIIANFFGFIQAIIILYFKIKNQLRKPSLILAQTKSAPNSQVYPVTLSHFQYERVSSNRVLMKSNSFVDEKKDERMCI